MDTVRPVTPRLTATSLMRNSSRMPDSRTRSLSWRALTTMRIHLLSVSWSIQGSPASSLPWASWGKASRNSACSSSQTEKLS